MDYKVSLMINMDALKLSVVATPEDFEKVD